MLRACQKKSVIALMLHWGGEALPSWPVFAGWARHTHTHTHSAEFRGDNCNLGSIHGKTPTNGMTDYLLFASKPNGAMSCRTQISRVSLSCASCAAIIARTRVSQTVGVYRSGQSESLVMQNTDRIHGFSCCASLLRYHSDKCLTKNRWIKVIRPCSPVAHHTLQKRGL